MYSPPIPPAPFHPRRGKKGSQQPHLANSLMMGNLFLDDALALKFRHGIDRPITNADVRWLSVWAWHASVQPRFK